MVTYLEDVTRVLDAVRPYDVVANATGVRAIEVWWIQHKELRCEDAPIDHENWRVRDVPVVAWRVWRDASRPPFPLLPTPGGHGAFVLVDSGALLDVGYSSPTVYPDSRDPSTWRSPATCLVEYESREEAIENLKLIIQARSRAEWEERNG